MEWIRPKLIARGICVAAAFWIFAPTGGCASAEIRSMADPYGPLTQEEEDAYMVEMAAADAYVRDEDD